MRFKSSLIAVLIAILGLSACGGDGVTYTCSGNCGQVPDTSGSAEVTSLGIVDSVLGTGTGAVNGDNLSVRYTVWLYNSAAAGKKGAQVESNVPAATPLQFKLGDSRWPLGWTQGLTGVKAGGKRTLTVPSNLAYGEAGSAGVPANAALLVDIEVIKIN
jgi:FKBP-type peptidyl-prolyl cis-trans isomerase FkpA